MLATTSPPRTSPNPVEGKAGGSSTPATRHEVANKRTLMEAAMSDPADAGEDDPPETAYGPPPDPPKTAWTPVGVQPGERAWSCPRAQSAHKFNVRKTGLMKLGCPPEDVDAIGYFHAFFPMRDMEDAIALMNERATVGEQYFPTPFTTAEFHVFLGVNFAMCKYQTVSQDELWAQPDPQNLMSVDYGFRKHMSLRRFKLRKKYLCMPLNTESGGETIIVKDWLKRINAHWNNNYTPGSVICCDETMFAWMGLCGDLHLTFLPRKPHPIGWMLKSAACVNGMIYSRLELAECKEDMKLKKYVQEYNATTACTLRLVEPWFKSGRIVVADSWFGSVRCALQLSARDMFSVLAVKGGKARYPKEELLAATEEVRFSTCFRTATFPAKKPGDHADEDIRIRSKYEGGKIVKHRYPISQPNCHPFYRHHFNAIDILNKLSVGPNSVSTAWQTREHMKKFFMCTLAVSSKRVAEGDADYDRKGKRPAQPAAVEAPPRTIHAPEDGWLDKDGKVHRRHTADARILQRDLDDVFQIYDLLAPAEEPLRDLVEDGADLPASSPASPAELFKTITAALALCTTVALRINKRGKKLHVEHEYGAEVAKEFDAVDPLGGKGSADYKELKKAIEKVKAKKPSSSSSREKPSSSSREPESFHRGSDDRREGGRREEKSPSVVSATSHQLAGDAFV
eukprot:jgi/Tetstr1/425580/TSEL_016001.t1